jgi:hypothetical protein
MQDAAQGLRRTLLLGTWVNKGKKKIAEAPKATPALSRLAPKVARV